MKHTKRISLPKTATTASPTDQLAAKLEVFGLFTNFNPSALLAAITKEQPEQ